MKNLAETDINRFIKAQEVPYFCGYKQALEEVKNGRKTTGIKTKRTILG